MRPEKRDPCRVRESVSETVSDADRLRGIGGVDEHIDVGHGTQCRVAIDAVRQGCALEQDERNTGVVEGPQQSVDAGFARDRGAAMAAR